MIFAETWRQVLAGTKHQTVRVQYAGDQLVDRIYTASHGWRGCTAVVDSAGRVRWQVGREYAVQPGRCLKAVGRIRCTSLAAVADPTAVDEAWAIAEGFPTLAAYLQVWHRLHPKTPMQPCWAIGFELIQRIKDIK